MQTTFPIGETKSEPEPVRRGAVFSGAWLGELYSASSWLTVVGFLMMADLGVSVLGLIFDPVMITGAPAWMKPLKFAISTVFFALTLAWMIGRLKRTRRVAGWIGRLLAGALTMEIVLIDMQAARHTTSHFNFTTRFDSLVFGAMGVGIALVFLSTGGLLAATCVERFEDRGLGWAMRLGLVLALAGMGVGSLMTMPTPEQLAGQAQTRGRMGHIGAHTVGGPDGGAAMPVTGWSADHGDLRIAHFIGLHGMQVLLLSWWGASRIRRGAAGRSSLGWVLLVTVGCAGAFGIVLAQALSGQPLLRPGSATVGMWCGWLACTLGGAAWLLLSGRNGGRRLTEETAG